MAQALAALILAGGAGERYGTPKLLARLPDGSSFLARCTATLIAAGARPVLATVPPGSTTEPPDVTVLPLPAPGLDMFASLRLGLARLLDDPNWQIVAVLPVDHPLVAASSITSLAVAARPVAVPRHAGKRGHPVCFERAVAEGILSGRYPGPTLREVLREVGRIDVDLDDPGVVANCNTPERLAAALVELAARVPPR